MTNFSDFKKFFLNVLIGSLIMAAIVAVIAVLTGDFNDVMSKAMFTLLMVVIHSTISLFFIHEEEKTSILKGLSFISNVLFMLVVISFITSICGVWDMFAGKTILHLYGTYVTLFFSLLYIDVLSRALNKESYIDKLVYFNYLFVFIIFIMFQPLIYIHNSFNVLGEQFFRILGAVAIIDGTISILIIIFYKIYLHKHPVIEDPTGQMAVKKTSSFRGLFLAIIIFIFLSILLKFIPRILNLM
ncbi:MAG: hypothetical protein WCT42_03885 [Candidatus Paceibacterota bacterium]|jgi:hypothetical protein